VGPAAELNTWSFACPDWEQRLREGRSLVPDLPLDLVEAERAVGIFNKLRLPDVPGQPAMAEAAGEWFRDLVRAAFGSLDPVTGHRMVEQIFALVPKKNSKTTGGAGIALTATLMNKRPNAELQLIGPTQEIAQVAYDQAVGMIEADPAGYLKRRFQTRDHLKTIVDRRNGAELKIKTFDMKVTTGSKPVFVLLDELHLMATIAQAARIIGQIRGNMDANPERLLLIITTQSDQPPAGVFKQELQYARGVRDGRIQGGKTLPILYEFPEAMQTAKDRPWLDPKNWPMVLPNLGRSIEIQRLRDTFAEAQEKGEEEVRRWASQHLNVEIGLALHTDHWAGARYWLSATDPKLTLAELIRRSEVIVGGVDGGGLDDLLGAAVLGRCKRTKRWLHWAKAWVQPDVLELRKEIAPRLKDLEAAGELVICESPTQDFEELVALYDRIRRKGLFPDEGAIGLDAAGVTLLVEALHAKGFTESQLAAVPQGYRLNGVIKATERKLKDGTFVHGPSELMAWCVGNAKVELRGSAVLITKQASGTAKIDPLAATFNAADMMSRNPEAAGVVDLDGFLRDAVMSA
jgi:phage terminase large subunit-like protein